MRVFEIDLWTLESVKSLIENALIACDKEKVYFAFHSLGKALTLLETAQPQPEVTDAGRKAALDALERLLTDAVKYSHYTDNSEVVGKWRKADAETIRAALSAPSVQEVTVDKLLTETGDYLPFEGYKGDTYMAAFLNAKIILRAIAKKFPNGLRIVRGEGG